MHQKFENLPSSSSLPFDRFTFRVLSLCHRLVVDDVVVVVGGGGVVVGVGRSKTERYADNNKRIFFIEVVEENQLQTTNMQFERSVGKASLTFVKGHRRPLSGSKNYCPFNSYNNNDDDDMNNFIRRDF